MIHGEEKAGTKAPGMQSQERINSYAMTLQALAIEAARRRTAIEDRWLSDALQYHGRYEDAVLKILKQDDQRSQVFVNQTRPKTKVMNARLVDLLFPTDQDNWDIEPTPVPRIKKRAAKFSDPNKYQINAREEDKARQILEFAKQRAANMRELMSDQMTECDYNQVGMLAIRDGCKYGTGVCKGPFADWTGEEWKPDPYVENQWILTPKGTVRDHPAFEHVPLWNFFPDPDAPNMKDAEYVFEVHLMSKKDMRRLARRKDFDFKSVEEVIENHSEFYTGDITAISEHSRTLRALDEDTEEGLGNRFEVLEYHGPVPYGNFREIASAYDRGELLEAMENPDEAMKVVDAVVWICQDRILKMDISPFESGDLPYSVFCLDKGEYSIFGYGVPYMMRDQQRVFNSAWRSMMDNAALSGAPMFIIDDTVEPVSGPEEVAPRKLWRRKTGAIDEKSPGIVAVAIDGRADQLIAIVELAKKLMEDETNIPLIAHGEGAAGPRQTAHGMTLLSNATNIMFRHAARNFDVEFTVPNLKRLYEWNMMFSGDDTVKGDMRVRAKGSSILLERSVQAQNLMMFLNMVATNEAVAREVHTHKLVAALVDSVQLSGWGILLSKQEREERDQLEAQQPQEDPDLTAKKEIVQMQTESAERVAQLNFQANLMKLALQEEMSLDKIAAELEKAYADITSKENLFMAEAALKEKTGEGI